MKGLPQFRVLRSEMDVRERAIVNFAEAQYPGTPRFLVTPAGRPLCPTPRGQELYNAAILEFDLARLPERVEAACHAIHQYRVQKRQSLSAAESSELDEALRVLFKLMQRAA